LTSILRSCFETLHVLALGPMLYVTWFVPIINMAWTQQYQIRKLHPKLQPPIANHVPLWPGASFRHGIWQVVTYGIPLFTLDFFLRKYYDGVDPEVWASQPYIGGLHLTRLLPDSAPTVREVVGHTVGALVLYDAMFFMLHYVLHTFPAVYTLVHKYHHDHESVSHHVTNQLTPWERVFLILTANFSLKLMRAHPLTRNVFTHAFIWLLMDSHSGYDFPVWLDKAVPLVGGSISHYTHHVRHSVHFAPLFTWLDWLAGTQLDVSSKQALLEQHRSKAAPALSGEQQAAAAAPRKSVHR